MPPKSIKSTRSMKSTKSMKSRRSMKSGTSGTTDNQTDIVYESTASSVSPRNVSLTLVMKGGPQAPGELMNLCAYFNGFLLLSGKWANNAILESEAVPVINLNNSNVQTMVANAPLILLLRAGALKVGKETDPLSHADNRAGASVDLFPFLLGEEKILVTTPLVAIESGEKTGCSVIVRAISPGTNEEGLIPLVLTMISIHCLPEAKENTFYLSAIGLNEIHEPQAINFNLSLSTPTAKKVVFASASAAGHAANTAMNVHTEDLFIPHDLQCQDTSSCRCYYWNAMRRVLVDPDKLLDRLYKPFIIQVAGVPRTGGKSDVRGRYMGYVDARALLEPGQLGVTVCSKLIFQNDLVPGNIGSLLGLPPSSTKASARDPDLDPCMPVMDEFEHTAYAVIRLDLTEALVPKSKLENLYQILGFLPPEKGEIPTNQGSETDSLQLVSGVDAKTIRKEGGALAVHKELCGLACKGMIPMNQGIKRTAANRLLMRVRTMLKSFPPGECSYLDYEDIVTGQHAASRRAVTASFNPQPPPPRLPDKTAAARSRMAGDTRIADSYLETSLKVPGSHESSISKILRSLEKRNNKGAKKYLNEALKSLPRNRYLLWIFGGLQFDDANEAKDKAGAALRIAVKGEYSDGTGNAIGWAAMHTFHHCNDNTHAAFVAAKKMRKSFSLPVEWDRILSRWIETSGEEEVYWIPGVVTTENPLLLAAAFFLCLRCYKFTEKLLQCVEHGCASRGSLSVAFKICPDVYYLRAASLVLRNDPGSALLKIHNAIHTFGPTPKMIQMRAICLARSHAWDSKCEIALQRAERCGAQLCSSLLYSAALSGFKVDPMTALQRAATAHKNNPSGHTALLIGRIYALLDKQWFAERWLAAAVNTEPLLADGWAMLALLATYDKNLNKARVMLRTARQAGPVSPDIEEELEKVMSVMEQDQLPDFLVENLCFCDHLN